jgi:hypothetical protein
MIGVIVSGLLLAGKQSYADDSCIYAFDHQCNEPGIGSGYHCAPNTDDSDCGRAPQAKPAAPAADQPRNSGAVGGVCVYANDGQCNDPTMGGSGYYCPPGTDVADCGGQVEAPAQPAPADAEVEAGPGQRKPGQPGGDVNPNPMLGRNAITPPGLNPYFVGSSPGNGSPVGTWTMSTSTTWSKVSEEDTGDKIISEHEFVAPESAGRLTIAADGTWTMKSFGKVTQGRWFDIGSNVIRLADYNGKLDATASVWNEVLDLQDEVGLRYYGRRQ